ncbi:MAG: flagellar biosynthetic protein FliO [Fibrobacteria bacterium]
MNSNGPVTASAAFLLAAWLAAPIASAASAKSLYSAPVSSRSGPEAISAAAPADLPPPPPSPAMEEKFRKLQKEMERKDPGGKASVAKAQENNEPESIGVGSLAMQVLFGLAFVLLLAVVSIRGLKRMQGRMLSKPGKGGDIFEVLETCHLGSHQRVVALRMNDEVGILGVTQQGISLLTVLKEPADDLRRERAGESNSAAFSDNLNKLLERFKKPKKVSDLLDEGAA